MVVAGLPTVCAPPAPPPLPWTKVPGEPAGTNVVTVGASVVGASVDTVGVGGLKAGGVFARLAGAVDDKDGPEWRAAPDPELGDGPTTATERRLWRASGPNASGFVDLGPGSTGPRTGNASRGTHGAPTRLTIVAAR